MDPSWPIMSRWLHAHTRQLIIENLEQTHDKILTKSSFLFAESLVGLWLNSITLSNRSNIWKNQTQITVIKIRLFRQWRYVQSSNAQNEAFPTQCDAAYLTYHFTTVRKKINKCLHFDGFPITLRQEMYKEAS